MQNKGVQFKKVCENIKSLKIQGATNIAKAAVNAYFLKPEESTKKILIDLRPTEPMLVNALNSLNYYSKEKIFAHFSEAQNKINLFVLKIMKNNSIIYTHCHSTNVINALIYAKKQGKKFEVYNTETRPLFQGRKTSKELAEAGIKVTEFVDSAMHEAIKKADFIFLGADALLESGAINKIGSGAIAEISEVHKKQLYIVADSWKFSSRNVKIEERDFHEVWKNVPKHIKVRNPAFEKVEKKYIKRIVSEFGILKYQDFLKKVKLARKI
jgi:ribose 1,5-bisphosphate isomerase